MKGSGAGIGIGMAVVLCLVSGCTGGRQESDLCEAVRARDVERAQTLLDGTPGADPNGTVVFEGNLTTPFRVALMALGESEVSEAIVLTLLAAGGDPDTSWSFTSPGETGESVRFYALDVAARAGRPAVVEALIEAGAIVDVEPGGEALIAAALHDDVGMLETLLDAGAPINYKDRSGRTPLWAAVEAVAREAIAFLEARHAEEW